jgi:hypothetical protein
MRPVASEAEKKRVGIFYPVGAKKKHRYTDQKSEHQTKLR